MHTRVLADRVILNTRRMSQLFLVKVEAASLIYFYQFVIGNDVAKHQHGTGRIPDRAEPQVG